jgi:hypothetical protein
VSTETLYVICAVPVALCSMGGTSKDESRLRGEEMHFLSAVKGCTRQSKEKFSLYRPWRPVGLRDVEVPTFSDTRLIDGGKVISPTRRPLFTTRKIPGTHFC